ncbi:MAG: replication-associated recombination protein A [Gammaproteobacteria bacterium]|nr:replication-associated recombination protein A [Gammaproteobacteria bacterium]MCH9744462.1 replication-associated recombination protein A [Gammaproteobacteria bacterium]
MSSYQPLAMRMRPTTLDHFVGQQHLLAEGKPLRQAIMSGHLHSMILWGPPGTGKTTLAEIIAAHADASIERISAVLAGVKDIREVVRRAELLLQANQRKTVLFVDEVHRFNKAQQDAFLPHVEAGTITLIGATTENPSFELNNALLSRARVYVLKALTQEDLANVVTRALTDKEQGYGKRTIEFDQALRDRLLQFADGDARQCLNILEILVDFAERQNDKEVITEQSLNEVLVNGLRRFDKGGEAFYDQISALHKAVRGSNPDASLYWFCRMIDGGCDPLYVARRIVRMASEDIGNADPRALQLALDAWNTYDRLGSPEGELALAQAVVYMACAAKSNAVYTAYHAAMKAAKSSGSLEVPLQLRNAPTKLMKDLGYHKGYRYAHDEPDAYAAGEDYFPEGVSSREYYHPVARGLEIKIAEKLKWLQSKDNKVK